MNEIMLFIDGSVSTKLKIGYGAYLSVSKNEHSLESYKTQVKLKRFDNTSSSKLEIQTLLWALNDIQPLKKDVIIYTDSQNIMSLLKRHDYLKQNDFHSKKKNRLSNYELYKEYYRKIEELNCKFIKVQGHKPSDHKDYIDRLFSFVDKAARKALRNDLSNIQNK